MATEPNEDRARQGQGRAEDGLPRPPLTPTAAGAAQVHELFMSYVAAGFTRPEALEIVIAQLVEMMRWNSEHGAP